MDLRGTARGVALTLSSTAALITCVPAASIPATSGPPPAVAPADAGVAEVAVVADGGVGPVAAADAGATGGLDAVIAGTVDRRPPPRTPPPEHPTAPPPPLRYPLDATATRALATIGNELGALEAQLAAAPAGSPDRPALLWRLAAAYREFAVVASADPVRGPAAAEEATRTELARLATLREEAPLWCAAPGPAAPTTATGCGDEQQYLIARAYQRLGDLVAARQAYFALIKSWPTSRLLAAAYTAFGEVFLTAAATDPSQLGLAAQSFDKAAELATADRELLMQVRYRLAYVAWLRGELPRARAALTQAIALAQAAPGSAVAAPLTARALADLVPVYVASGAAAADAPGVIAPLVTADDQRVAWLDALRVAYVAAGEFPGALTLTDALDRVDHGPASSCARWVDQLELLAWAVAAPAADVDARMLRLLGSFFGRPRDADGTAACRARAAGTVTTILIARDLDLVGPAAAPGSRDPDAVARLIRQYQQASAVLGDDDFAAATFPRLPAGPRPTRAWLLARAAALAPLAP